MPGFADIAGFALFLLALPAPGAVVLRAAGGEGVFVASLVSLSTASLVSLALALAGLFHPAAAAGGQIAAALLLFVTFGRRAGEESALSRARRLPSAAALLVAAVAAVLFLRPHEYVFGGWDPGVYVNTGLHLARTGALGETDPLIASLPPGELDLFIHERHGMRQKYPGFVIRNPEEGRIWPYFYHLFPVWAALLAAGLGPAAGLFAAPLFGLLSLWAVAVIGRLLHSRTAGLLAAAFLALNTAQIWQARFPTSEMTAQFFLLGGLAALALFIDKERPVAAVAAALAFGCALCTKITALFTVSLAAAAFAAVWAAAPRRGRLWFPAALGAVLVPVAIYYALACREATSVVFTRAGVAPLAMAGVVVVGILLAAAAGAVSRRRVDDRTAGYARHVAAVLLLAGAGYAALVRPRISQSPDAANLIQLGWFVGIPALVAALGGLIYLVYARSGRSAGPLAAAAVLLAMTVFFLAHKRVAPFYPWALRRFLPEAVPFLAVAGGIAVAALRDALARRGLLRFLWLVAAAAVVTGSLIPGRTLVSARDYAGARRWTADLAAALPAEGLFVCRGSWLATPLHYQFGRETLQLSDLTPGKARAILDAMADWIDAGRDVYYLTGQPGFFTGRLAFEPVGAFPLRTAVTERSRRARPGRRTLFAPTAHLYRVSPFVRGAAPLSSPARIDVAVDDFGLGDGFYAPGRIGSGAERVDFRWTSGRAVLAIPVPPGGRERGWRVTLRLASGRPAGAAVPSLRVLVAGREVGTVSPGPGFADHPVRIPPGIATPDTGAVTLEVRTETFNPLKEGLSADSRDLGVMWESVVIGGAL